MQKAGREMQVTDIVTGHYLKEGNQLQVTLEAVNVNDNRIIWRDTLTAATPDMISMREQVTAKVRQGLLPEFWEEQHQDREWYSSQERRGLRPVLA